MNWQQTFKEEAGQFGIEINNQHLQKFEQYFTLLIEWNQKVNLTSITEPYEVARKHFLDSLLLVKDINFSEVRSIIDVGTGAGFPGVPLKIFYPHLEVTLLDALQKRCVFLDNLKTTLQLDGVNIIHERAEIASRKKDLREKYDLATARAVANLRVIAEYCLPFVKTGGYFIASKGKDGPQEVMQAKNGLGLLGAKLDKINSYQLPQDVGERNNVIIKKVSITPAKYPRRAGLPEKKPL